MLPGAPLKTLDEAESTLVPNMKKRRADEAEDTDEEVKQRRPKYPKEVVRTDAREQKLDRFLQTGRRN